MRTWYARPFVKFGMVYDLSAATVVCVSKFVKLFELHSIMYAVIAAPPLFAGASQLTSRLSSLIATTRFCGTPGKTAGISERSGVFGWPAPTSVTA